MFFCPKKVIKLTDIYIYFFFQSSSLNCINTHPCFPLVSYGDPMITFGSRLSMKPTLIHLWHWPSPRFWDWSYHGFPYVLYLWQPTLRNLYSPKISQACWGPQLLPGAITASNFPQIRQMVNNNTLDMTNRLNRWYIRIRNEQNYRTSASPNQIAQRCRMYLQCFSALQLLSWFFLGLMLPGCTAAHLFSKGSMDFCDQN